MKHIRNIIITLFFGLLSACGGSNGDSQNGPVSFSLEELSRLANGFHYEGWAIIDGAPISTGKFNVTDNNDFERISDAQNGVDYSRTSTIVLTIEPTGDIDALPSATKYLAANVVDREAVLTTEHPAVIGNTFSNASGSFIITTPTDGPNTNEESGVWFLDPTAGPAASLDLPTLPEGWVYEGWAVVNGDPLSTGRFSSTAGSDSFGGFSGELPSPPFPGEDFLVNAPEGVTFPIDLREGTIVITVEPSPDDSTAPFALKPLVGTVPADVTIGSNNSLGNESLNFPSVLANIQQ